MTLRHHQLLLNPLPLVQMVPIQYLVVGGGGSGAGKGTNVAGGSGGAGGMFVGLFTPNPGAVLTATVGAGGAAGQPTNNPGLVGSNSVLSGAGLTTVTALGGGFGGFPAGGNGGSGGSTTGSTGPVGTGTVGQGYDGSIGQGTFGSSSCASGGGGGAGGAGGVTASGPGRQTAITGTNIVYATGGEWAYHGTSANGITAAPNTGNGGQGAGGNAGAWVGGGGGSGVVILRLLTSGYTGLVTGSPTVTVDGLYTVIKFTSGGTYTAASSSPPVTLGILDGYATSLWGAYSLFRLFSTATFAVRVRRSNDNAEQDIGFSGTALDTVALAAFVGANNAFVVTWYDQSGGGRHATIATAVDQPRIVTAGTYLGVVDWSLASSGSPIGLATVATTPAGTGRTCITKGAVRTFGNPTGSLAWLETGGTGFGLAADTGSNAVYVASGSNRVSGDDGLNTGYRSSWRDSTQATNANRSGHRLNGVATSQLYIGGTMTQNSTSGGGVFNIGGNSVGSTQRPKLSSVVFYSALLPIDTQDLIGELLALAA